MAIKLRQAGITDIVVLEKRLCGRNVARKYLSRCGL
nr:NAD(P)-binding domain-containing protein [Shewanella vesiculosa]